MTASTTVTYTVEGMSCQHCVGAVTEELTKLPGVREVVVDLPSGGVQVTSDAPLDRAAVAAAVDEAGYELAGSGSGAGGGS
ncbi:MAG: heavy-metal-associated domain-containing protein [Acidimicrobiia bacterium]